MLRARLVLSACLVPGAGLACSSDDLDFANSTTTGASSSTSGVPTTGTPEPETGSSSTTGESSTGPGESSGDETTELPPEQTCEDVLMCVGGCALELDPACFQMCAEGLQPDEAMKAIELALCVGMGCFETEACTPETLQDPLCLACIGFGILNKNPPGCERQAEACM